MTPSATESVEVSTAFTSLEHEKSIPVNSTGMLLTVLLSALDSGSFTGSLTHVVELSSSDSTLLNNLDLLDPR